ncbi:MAG TPA: hypothetical protein VFC07_10630 [Verrucomicrobiae bacterium]|nr:hypothetical protein [Verrucomicrobiae bacterium]
MKVTPSADFRQKYRFPAGLVLILLVGSVEAWMFWRLGIDALRALEKHGKAALLAASCLPFDAGAAK